MFLLSSASSFHNCQRCVPLNKKLYDTNRFYYGGMLLLEYILHTGVIFLASVELKRSGKG